MKKSTIGILLIVKNEEKHLAQCLDSVHQWADEIVIVDSGSTDKTEEIARQYTDKFYSHKTWEGFGKQRQIAQSYMTSDWVFALDADERVTDTLKDSIQTILEQSPRLTCYSVNRLSEAMGKQIRHSGWYPDKIVRLFPRTQMKYNDSLVHESVDVPDSFRIKNLDGDLLHFTFDNLPQYINKTSLYMKSWADQREGKRTSSLFGAIGHGFFRFFKMYILQRGFLDGRHGLLLAILSANTTFTRYADLWIRSYVEKKQGDKK